MVYQPLETRIERLNNHVEVVSAHYRRALANIEFYPDPRKLELRDQITSEYQNFNKAAALVREGRIVKDIQEHVCGEARSWVKGNIPAGIARYSFYQISEQELTQRSAVCRQLVRACKGRLTAALDTIEKLSKHDGDPRKSTIQKVREEFATLEHALTLYERGFSFVEIKALTGESIQARVEDKTIPETLVSRLL
jgi:exonuclease VII small subunit